MPAIDELDEILISGAIIHSNIAVALSMIHV